MSKHYNEKEAIELLTKIKNIEIEVDKDPRLSDPDGGVLFARSVVNYDVLDAMATGVKSRAVIKYAGVKWNFRLLSTLEHAELDCLVEDFMKKVYKKEMSFEFRAHVRMAIILYKAMTSCPEAEDSILKVKDLLHMDLNSFVGLYKEYQLFVEKCDIGIDEISDETFYEVLELIEKKQLTYRDLSHRMLARMAHFYNRYYKIVTQLKDNTLMPLSADTITIES